MRKNEISNMRITFAFSYTETGKPIGPILTLPVNPKASDEGCVHCGQDAGRFAGLGRSQHPSYGQLRPEGD